MKVQLLSLICLIASCSASNFNCPEKFDPQNPTFFPHPDCTKYFVCNWHSVVEQNCPPGLHWNVQANYCDWPSLAGCLADPVVTPPTTPVPTVAPTTAKPTTPSTPGGQCPEVYDPSHQVYFPHGTDCSRYYICTYEGTKLEQRCPAGLHWSAQNNYCDHPDRAQCRITSGVSQASPVECSPEESQDTPVFLPHGSDCTKYYVCDNGHLIQMDCPAGLFWNAVETTCDNPEHSGCVQRVLLRLW